MWAHPGKGVAEASSPAEYRPLREGGGSGLTQGKGWLRPPHLPKPPPPPPPPPAGGRGIWAHSGKGVAEASSPAKYRPLREGGGSGLTQGKGWLRPPHLPNTALQDLGGWGIWAHSSGKGVAEASSPAEYRPLREGGGSGLTQGKGWLRPPHLPNTALREGGGSMLTQGKGWLSLLTCRNPPLRQGGGSGLTPHGKGRLGLLTCRIPPCRIREGGASGLTQGKGRLRS